jgi:hypothetical protein
LLELEGNAYPGREFNVHGESFNCYVRVILVLVSNRLHLTHDKFVNLGSGIFGGTNGIVDLADLYSRKSDF